MRFPSSELRFDIHAIGSFTCIDRGIAIHLAEHFDWQDDFRRNRIVDLARRTAVDIDGTVEVYASNQMKYIISPPPKEIL